MKASFLSLYFFFLLLHISHNIRGQDYQLLNTIEPFDGKFTTDYLGNIYQYNSGDLTRYDPSGNRKGVYSTRVFGEISFVDASDALKILVVYETFSKAVILDNGLSANAEFDLSLPGIPAFSLICISREGGYWIFDPVQKQLKKINEQMVVTMEGTSLHQITGKEVIPKYISDSGKWLIIYADDIGFMIFDRYGTYYKTIHEKILNGFQASYDELMFKSGNAMKIIDIKSGIVKNFILPENKEEDDCRVESRRIFIRDTKSLKIYSY